jgi:glycosyltransferase involved in cell wall biosynthesis
MTSLAECLTKQSNDYDFLIDEFERRTGLRWDDRINKDFVCGNSVSVIIPARNAAYSLRYVLDSLLESKTTAKMEVIIVDDGSTDDTVGIAKSHPLGVKIVSLPERYGASVARNIGTVIAHGDTIIYLDADMVLPDHVIQEHAARTSASMVGIGFRHNIPYAARSELLNHKPIPPADLERDLRMMWHVRPGHLHYSGIDIKTAVTVRALEESNGLRRLGHGSRLLDWDLPRMVVSCLMSAPKAAVISVGGFEPGFARGWGVEDTHLGAKLICAGLKVVPFCHAVGFHIDPPDAAEQWKLKLAAWGVNIEYYKHLLEEPVRADLSQRLQTDTERILQTAQTF